MESNFKKLLKINNDYNKVCEQMTSLTQSLIDGWIDEKTYQAKYKKLKERWEKLNNERIKNKIPYWL